MGIQTLRAAEATSEEGRTHRTFLRLSCTSSKGQEILYAFFTEVETLADAMRQDSERWTKLAERCQKKTELETHWDAQVVMMGEKRGTMGEACVEDQDCGVSLSCETVAGRCIPAFRISNLPVIY